MIVMGSSSKQINKTDSRTRKGLRIRGNRGNPVVRRALIRFSRWLRAEFDFPIRVLVYLFQSDHIITQDGEKVSASFFAPYQRDVEPYIRIATGDYVSLSKEVGRDNALAAYLCSLAHEIVHYRQWIETGETWERGVCLKARKLVDIYAMTVDHP
jgi:hypothetical protein